jgi:hypothetical protein
MEFKKVIIWAGGFVAMAVCGYMSHRYAGWYDWKSFPSGPFLRQVLLPALLIGAICGLTVWIVERQK